MVGSFATSAVLITGASRGIGRVIATTFAKKTDHPLILVARSTEGLEQTKTNCRVSGAAQVCTISCDLTDPDAVKKIRLKENFDPPGIIINNAGIFLLKCLTSTSYNDFLNQIKTNLFSAVHIVDRFLPGIKELDGGLIINICSSAALDGSKDSGAYASSKHALLGYTRSLRAELMESNIGVTALNLGQTQSTSWKDSTIAPEQLIDPQDVANLLVAISMLSSRSVVEEIMLIPQHGRVPPM